MDFTQARIQAIVDTLKDKIMLSDSPLENISFVSCGYKADNQPPKDGFAPFEAGSFVQGKDAHFWFHLSFKTPNISENQQINFHLSTTKDGLWDALNPQALIYINGKMVQGLDINHQDVLLDPENEYDIYIYFYSGMIEKSIQVMPSLQIIDTQIEGLYYDLSVPLQASRLFEDRDGEYLQLIQILFGAVQLLDLRDFYSAAFYESIQNARAYLKQNLYTSARPDGPVVTCIGHTHIDVAWQWTLAQTREKTQRSFSTVLNLMRQYPEYQFMSSQPQLYKYLKQEAPDVYENVREAVRSGRWEAEGAMWLEADCNLTSGESLVRQLIYGKRFMQQEFGVDNKILWLPDVFGYSAALPQILKKCGVDKFVTSKISWNDSNQMPLDTFMWEGIDGTEIFTYFITAQDLQKKTETPHRYTTYVGYIRPEQVYGTWARYQQKEYNNEVMITYGYGDGGGGPTKDMLEQQRRLSYGLPGLPRTQMDSATNMLNRVEKRFFENCARLGKVPKWIGELYLELHRGTYTTMAYNKYCNRKSELSYQAAEGIAYTAFALLNQPYPKKALQDGWETILLNQFHDIIPGSSIKEVYDESAKQYADVLSTSKTAFDTALCALKNEVRTEGGWFVYNPNSAAFTGVIQANDNYIYVTDIPGHGWKVVKPDEIETGGVTLTHNTLENDFLKLTLNDAGQIISLYDKEADRELVQKGQTLNQFCIYEDFPYAHDAWDLPPYYKDKKWAFTANAVTPVDEGARKGLRLTCPYGKSTLIQTIYLYKNSRRVDFETYVNWQESHVTLKAEFPLDVHATEASYEIQFGSVKRPNTQNTSWEAAKFEVCAQKWADLSEDAYGVSLLNNCKYGHSAVEGTLTLTLLRAPAFPNPTADRGEHHFTYSLYPHNHRLDSDTVQEAFVLNRPPVCTQIQAQNGSLADNWSLVSTDSEDIIIDTVKQAEENDDFIIRLYECCNRRTKTTLHFGIPVASAALCNMLEETESDLTLENNSLTLHVNPFEIITLKLKIKK